uniref:Uncharacterized protein n=1 Tax=Biomphalaria glabrata TaxID=6526 RepID=A0A182YTN3_BIOGL
MLCCSPLFGL